MPDASQSDLRVGLISDFDVLGQRLKEVLETNGLQVVSHYCLQQLDISEVKSCAADVLVIELDESAGQAIDNLELLIEECEIPLLFNEGGVPRDPTWGRKLRDKLQRLVNRVPARQHPEPIITSDADTAATAPAAGLQIVASQDKRRPKADEVWVFGASLGGPQAVKALLCELPKELPVGMILAQHIGPTFVPLLAEQLQRASGIPVMPAQDGRPILTGEVVLVPVDSRFTLTEDGCVAMTNEHVDCAYRPCIDDVMMQVAQVYKHRAHAVIFSGMGNDGALGAAAVVRAGGTVYAQSTDSCVISSMPDSVRNMTTVNYTAAPEELARRMAEQIASRHELQN